MKGVFDSNILRFVTSFNSGSLAELKQKAIDLKILFAQIKYLQNLERYRNDETFKKLVCDIEDIETYMDDMIALKKRCI